MLKCKKILYDGCAVIPAHFYYPNPVNCCQLFFFFGNLLKLNNIGMGLRNYKQPEDHSHIMHRPPHDCFSSRCTIAIVFFILSVGVDAAHSV